MSAKSKKYLAIIAVVLLCIVAVVIARCAFSPQDVNGRLEDGGLEFKIDNTEMRLWKTDLNTVCKAASMEDEPVSVTIKPLANLTDISETEKDSEENTTDEEEVAITSEETTMSAIGDVIVPSNMGATITSTNSEKRGFFSFTVVNIAFYDKKASECELIEIDVMKENAENEIPLSFMEIGLGDDAEKVLTKLGVPFEETYIDIDGGTYTYYLDLGEAQFVFNKNGSVAGIYLSSAWMPAENEVDVDVDMANALREADAKSWEGLPVKVGDTEIVLSQTRVSALIDAGMVIEDPDRTISGIENVKLYQNSVETGVTVLSDGESSSLRDCMIYGISDFVTSDLQEESDEEENQNQENVLSKIGDGVYVGADIRDVIDILGRPYSRSNESFTYVAKEADASGVLKQIEISYNDQNKVTWLSVKTLA